MQFDVRDWVTAPETEGFYAEDNFGLVGSNRLQRMIYPTMKKLDESGSVDWFDGYIDDWGRMNNVVVIHSGYGAELGPRKCIPHEPPQKRIWSQGTGSSSDGWLSKDYFQVNGIAFAPALEQPKCDGETELEADAAGMGIIVHEYLHTFGLIDMYDQDVDEKRIPLGGVARFDMYVPAIGRSVVSHTCILE